MNRKTSRENIENIIKKIRNKIPEVTLRTSLIVGFPGETEKQFKELYEFVKEIKFDKLGVFEYSQEEGTPAAKLPDQIDEETKRKRYKQIMIIQQKISNMKNIVGKVEKVLIENVYVNKTHKYLVGRTKKDAPDIDGMVYVEIDLKNNEDKYLNTFVKCEITGYSNYDLIAKLL